MKDLFLFSSFFDSSHTFAYFFHLGIVIVIAMIITKLATSSMQLVPRGMQNLIEAYLEGVLTMGKDTLGNEKAARKYLPLVATLGVIIFLSNIIGIIPGFEAPTASLNLTLSLALIVFVYYHFEGIKTQGFIKYFSHFMGPIKILAPLMFPIEIISHLSRVISLSFRLFGNVKGDDLFLAVILALVPYIAPLPAYVLLTFMAFLQTFIFMILTYVYLAGATVIEEGH
ncbi:F0F1 ATP synthase subunit A [Campylobacter novaezeelandiae]|uniref:F0F1 ATP synthase subunit A n=1 Tax=Campylobacter novaezeelandiae TaxID=2267891 RepID=UPI0010372962|nr:F0F1 ATP synthase subunit A [Campylobacter novaezeelandiae]MBK1964567.1 F0F1 ATP synthase subunit A [Campylobacter novaezeelandiae]MBK1993538.1 F0F1 ATP synthase subunit A [Campylobacter novaezeelandiae]QWU80478.1 ATP synthase, F0 complex, a subunit [Campylobacter novaezeelandiae]TBR78128.1 F0F1 ATP synthase subunit A [Campylobacter novaezeelandiae]TBR78413.1 F0F1 ATP synthase subunit A [Campylobacter novaezeelandiae]